jgi:hypothetical protein
LGNGTPRVTQVDNVEFHDDLAMVRVVVPAGDEICGDTACRELRFYRQTQVGWVRVPLQIEFWGPERTLHTPHFLFIYHERDEAAVESMAEEIEHLLAAMRRDVGLTQLALLPPPYPMSVYTVHVSPHFPFPNAVPDQQTLQIPSPASLPLSLTDSEHTVLRQNVVDALSNQLMAEVYGQDSPYCNWNTLLRGLRLWLFHTYGGSGDTLDAWLKQQPVFRLTSLAHICDCSTARSERSQTEVTIAVSLIAYIEGEWGKDTLSSFVAALSEYNTWDQLVPAVFGVSQPEFERSWREWIPPKSAVQSPRTQVR